MAGTASGLQADGKRTASGRQADGKRTASGLHLEAPASTMDQGRVDVKSAHQGGGKQPG